MSPAPFLLPSAPSTDITVVTLPHPRSSVPTRYILHSTQGLHEITKISSPSAVPRSWLLSDPPTPPTRPESPPATKSFPEAQWIGNGHVIQDGSIYISTPIDPLFLLLPHLLPAAQTKSHFLPMDDLLDSLSEQKTSTGKSKPNWEKVLKNENVSRRAFESRIRTVCDTVDVGGENAYRLSRDKVLKVVAKKCEDMAKGGLPQTIEDEFVTKALVRPMHVELGDEGEKVSLDISAGKEGEVGTGDKASEEVKVETRTKDKASEEVKPEEISDSTDASKNEIPNSIASRSDELSKTKLSAKEPIDSSTPAAPQQEAPLPPLPKLSPATPEIKSLLRLRISTQFLSARYLPPHISALLQTHVSTTHDFTPLDSYLSELKRLKAESSALRSADFSLKRGFEEQEAVDEERAEKKRKKEEEEKRKKKNVSKGVRDLGKVNTRGMAKMTSFFGKKG